MFAFRIFLAFIFILSAIPFNFCIAQVNPDVDYRKFQDEFSKETDSLQDDSLKKSKHVLHPAGLPDWIKQLPQSFDGTYYAIGISDPGMNNEKAFDQALLRAKSVLSFLLAPNFESLADNYSDEKSGAANSSYKTKYISFYRLQSDIIVNDSNVKVIENYFTSFNEAIVLIEVTPPVDESVVFSSVANIYQDERQNTGSYTMVEKYHMMGSILNEKNEKQKNYEYTIYSINNIFEINSTLNNTVIEFPYLNYRYTTDTTSIASSSENEFGSKMNYGFWKSFIESFLQELYSMQQDQPVIIKTTGDNYGSSHTKILTREISVASPALKLSSINLINNHLSVKLEYLN